MKKKDIIICLFVTLIIAVALSPFASSFPDGLEKVAEQKGFIEKGEKPAVSKITTSLSGLTGTLVVFGLAYGLASLLKKKEHNVKK